MLLQSKVLGVASVIGAAAVVGLITVSSTLAQTAFTQYNGADTEADWCLYVIWLCFMSTFIVAAFAIAVLVAACMDDWDQSHTCMDHWPQWHACF